MNKGRKTITMTALAATLVTLSVVSLAGEAQAQVLNLTPSKNPANSGYWYPNVYQGPTEPAYTPAPIGQPPPIGDGSVPMGINPGQMGLPILPPASQYPMPQIPPGAPGKAAATAALGGAITPPTSNNPTDPGSIHAPLDFTMPPVTVTQVSPGGGIQGDAPIQRWGAQTSQDFGGMPGGSSTTDYGEKLSQKSNLQKTPQFSQDGPRNKPAQGQSRPPNFPGAQQSTDLNGNRSTRKDGQKPILTIAPY